MSPCPLCNSSRAEIVGYRGLGLLLKCKDCEITFVENMSLEEDLLRAENAQLNR